MAIDSHRLFRPPAEADSLILRVVAGCPHNQCTFCGMYKGVRYRVRDSDEVARELRKAQRSWPDATRVFLADGDVMLLSFAALRELLAEINRLFPALARVGLYANGASIAAKTREELCELRNLLARLDLPATVFRANHASNIVPLEGRFPRDRERLLRELDALLASGLLDRHSPGPEPWVL